MYRDFGLKVSALCSMRLPINPAKHDFQMSAANESLLGKKRIKW